jgi:hypothetical protein
MVVTDGIWATQMFEGVDAIKSEFDFRAVQEGILVKAIQSTENEIDARQVRSVRK